MKIFGNKNENLVLYVQVKDLKLFGYDYLVIDKEDSEFVEIIDKNLCKELSNNSNIVTYNSSMSDGIEYIYNRILELEDLEDPILSNYRDDLEYIYYYRVGKGYLYPEIQVPLLTNYAYTCSCIENGVRYNAISCVDPYKVIITRDDGEKNFVAPKNLLKEVVGIITRIVGINYDDDFMYSIVDKVDDGKGLVYKISFIVNKQELKQIERKMNKEKENIYSKDVDKNGNLVSKLLKKINVFK